LAGRHGVAEACYRLAKELPREELFAMSSQIRRSASSVPANIAEGHGRENTQSFIQYLRIAQGSLKELETHLLLSARVGLLTESQLKSPLDQCAILGRKLRSLIRSLQQRATKR
jgi:four helix bundle protein